MNQQPLRKTITKHIFLGQISPVQGPEGRVGNLSRILECIRSEMSTSRSKSKWIVIHIDYLLESKCVNVFVVYTLQSLQLNCHL